MSEGGGPRLVGSQRDLIGVRAVDPIQLNIGLVKRLCVCVSWLKRKRIDDLYLSREAPACQAGRWEYSLAQNSRRLFARSQMRGYPNADSPPNNLPDRSKQP